MGIESASAARRRNENWLIDVSVSEWMRWNDIGMPVRRLCPPLDLSNVFPAPTHADDPSSSDP